jgi:hypothetical protein
MELFFNLRKLYEEEPKINIVINNQNKIEIKDIIINVNSSVNKNE